MLCVFQEWLFHIQLMLDIYWLNTFLKKRVYFFASSIGTTSPGFFSLSWASESLRQKCSCFCPVAMGNSQLHCFAANQPLKLQASCLSASGLLVPFWMLPRLPWPSLQHPRHATTAGGRGVEQTRAEAWTFWGRAQWSKKRAAPTRHRECIKSIKGFPHGNLGVSL